MPYFDLISDLHLDMRKNPMRMIMDIEPTSNALVIAGDLAEARNIQSDWLLAIAEKYPSGVLYVPGNHEFYGMDLDSTYDLLYQLAPRNFNVLHNDSAAMEDGGYYFGTTLWFPDNELNGLYESMMSDFSCISNFRQWVYGEHNSAKHYLRNSNADVWILHHLPLARSIHPKYAGSTINRFFLGDISDLLSPRIYSETPKVIVHGHTHEPCDYMAGDTRVVCNPLGYPNEGNHSIIPVKVSF